MLEVNGGQLDALSRDADVDHLSGDVPVCRMSAETTRAIGADQVWAGALTAAAGSPARASAWRSIDSGIAQRTRAQRPGRRDRGLHGSAAEARRTLRAWHARGGDHREREGGLSGRGAGRVAA